jgi:DNA-damage-inducible protein D
LESGKGFSQIVDDYDLSRFACYLIAQNGAPRKSEIAHAQKYFAIQTRRQELSDAMAADLERQLQKSALFHLKKKTSLPAETLSIHRYRTSSA